MSPDLERKSWGSVADLFNAAPPSLQRWMRGAYQRPETNPETVARFALYHHADPSSVTRVWTTSPFVQPTGYLRGVGSFAHRGMRWYVFEAIGDIATVRNQWAGVSRFAAVEFADPRGIV